MLLRRIARPLLATAFIVDGATMFVHPEPLTESRIATKSPTDPVRLVWGIAASRVGGGVLLALGKAPRLAALTLAASSVPVLLAEQEFRTETDPARRSAGATAFVKDVGLLGGLLLAVADTEGKPSLGWRGRRAAREAAETISAALPTKGAIAGALPTKTPPGAENVARQALDVLEHRTHDALEAARTLAEQARDEAVDLTNTARPIIAERGGELAESARRHGGRLIEVTRDRGTELAETARQRVSDRGGDLAETARHRIGDRGAELAETARKRVGDHGAEWAETARQRSAELAEAAKKRVSDRSTDLAESAKKTAKKTKKAAKKTKKAAKKRIAG